MNQLRQDYAEPEPPRRWPGWLRELAVVVLLLTLLEADRAIGVWPGPLLNDSPEPLPRGNMQIGGEVYAGDW